MLEFDSFCFCCWTLGEKPIINFMILTMVTFENVLDSSERRIFFCLMEKLNFFDLFLISLEYLEYCNNDYY